MEQKVIEKKIAEISAIRAERIENKAATTRGQVRETELMNELGLDEVGVAGGARVGVTRAIVIGPTTRYTRLAPRPARVLLDEFVNQGLVDLGQLWNKGILVETQRRGATNIIPILGDDEGGEE